MKLKLICSSRREEHRKTLKPPGCKVTTDAFAIILIPPKMMTAVTIAWMIAEAYFSIPNDSLNALVIVLACTK
ncbi:MULTISPECIES: hypothetical protein [unclassified Peribacillus]|uniref:hypothetical protein n=1 Tax=unclassified Peribacillus TaxID=2675266 RepID=UPI003670E1E8